MSAERNKSPLIIIAGPTATGKSAAAVKVAKEIGGEVISADSMQVYRGMDIGSAKITVEETEGVPHHLIDVLEPTEDFNVSIFFVQNIAVNSFNSCVRIEFFKQYFNFLRTQSAVSERICSAGRTNIRHFLSVVAVVALEPFVARVPD